LSGNRRALNRCHTLRSEFATDASVNSVILTATGALPDHFPRTYTYAPIRPHMIVGSRPKAITRSLRNFYAPKNRLVMKYAHVDWKAFWMVLIPVPRGERIRRMLWTPLLLGLEFAVVFADERLDQERWQECEATVPCRG